MADAESLRAWAPGRAVVLGVSVGWYAAAGAQATSCLASGEPWDWSKALFRWALYAVMGAVSVGFGFLGRFGTPDQRARRVALRAALRTGDLPAAADAEIWRPRLGAEEQDLRQARWAVLVLSQVIAVLVATAAVDADETSPGVWALAVALSAFVVVPLRWLSGRLVRIRALQAQLDAA